MRSAKLYVGIDVANAKVDVSFLNEEGRPVRSPASYGNDPQGWTALRTAIVAAARLVGANAQAICGMEATSNMHQRLAQALREERRCSVQVHVLNPRAVKHFARAMLKDSKTDRADSRLVALFLLRMRPQPVATLPEGFEEFQEATRTRRRMVEERTENKNRLHKLMRYHFPGYKKLLGKTFTKGVLAVLENWPSPDLILSIPQDKLALFQYGHTGRRIGAKLAEKLHHLAEQAPRRELPSVSRLLIQTTAHRVLELNDLITSFDRAIEDMLDEMFPDQVLTTIPGIGKVSAASILAEVGDIRRFTDKTQFVGYCGLYPVVWESGEAKKRYRMSKKGNRMLKMTLLVASAAARQYNPAISVYYERLRERGKSKKAAGGAIARKMAEIMFTMLVTGEGWSAEKAARGIEKGQAMQSETGVKQKAGPPCLTEENLVPETPRRAKSRSRGSRNNSIASLQVTDHTGPEPATPGGNG